METLLEKVGIINFKYEILRTKDSFNIFKILLNSADEVNLHSKFISELLDCAGSHNSGSIYAKNFLQTIGINNFLLEKYECKREYRYIDILLTNKSQAIIIENKIWANDQNKQLERYYSEIIKEGYKDVWLIYLTLDGREPSINSIGELKDKIEINLMSYNFHISKWIDECILLNAKNPQIRETLIQYHNTINDLTGNTMVKEQVNEIIELISKNDNVLKAQKIAESWIHLKWKTEFDFWNDLSKKISSKYKILDNQKFSSETIDCVIHQTRNRNPWYGIMFQIASYKDYNVNIYIERGLWDLYYGITIDKDGDRKYSDITIFNDFAERIKPFCDWEREDQWIGGKYFQPSLNFELFNAEETIKLCNKDYRKVYIDDLWIQIEDFIGKCKIELC